MEQAAGHGDILEDNDGNWWFAHLAFRQIHMWQTYHHLGREVCLVPVKWRDDGWFEIGVNGTTPIELNFLTISNLPLRNFLMTKHLKILMKNSTGAI